MGGIPKARIAKYTISGNKVTEQWQDAHGGRGSQQFRTITTKANQNGDQVITAYGRSGWGGTYSATYDLNGNKLESKSTDINRTYSGFDGTTIELQRDSKENYHETSILAVEGTAINTRQVRAQLTITPINELPELTGTQTILAHGREDTSYIIK